LLYTDYIEFNRLNHKEHNINFECWILIWLPLRTQRALRFFTNKSSKNRYHNYRLQMLSQNRKKVLRASSL